MTGVADTIYRDATFNAHTRAKLGLAYQILIRIEAGSVLTADTEIDLAGACEAVRSVCEAWDRNPETEAVFS